MDADVTFGEWLRQRRRTLDLTQKELANQVGCSAITIRKFEADERRPSKQLATLLAERLDVAPAEYNDFISFARSESYIDPAAPPSELAEPLPWQTSPPEAGDRPLPTPSLPLFLTKSASPEKLPPVFVARERELAELEATLETARSGAGQILFVIGGAGSGKTMLVQEFARRAQASDPDLLVVSGYCNAHTGSGAHICPSARR
jgi:transcriptional regulator with XRE-family HTH domain